jgi:hypothetical protein
LDGLTHVNVAAALYLKFRISTVTTITANTPIVTRCDGIQRGHIGAQDIGLDHVSRLAVLRVQHGYADNRRTVNN